MCKILFYNSNSFLRNRRRTLGTTYSTHPLGLGKPHHPANFEVATFSRCRNIKRKPQILGSSPSPEPRPLFFSGCNFMMGGKPKLHTKFEVASFSCCKNIKRGTPKFCDFFVCLHYHFVRRYC